MDLHWCPSWSTYLSRKVLLGLYKEITGSKPFGFPSKAGLQRGVYCLLLRLKIKGNRSFINEDLMHIISMSYLAKELSKPPVCTSRVPETTHRILEKQSHWIVVVDFSFV